MSLNLSNICTSVVIFEMTEQYCNLMYLTPKPGLQSRTLCGTVYTLLIAIVL